ncbi:MAG: SDR family NAD(P)-dependent oxidoreductase [Desulfohalobiaceae bacterium]|nr:SDR family NAD(P)-dependent oxidoreductase [Desulfohalobiaceae bacterium]
MLEIKNAVAVITGGGSGIGKAAAKYWAAQGGKLVLADIAKDNLEQVQAEIQKTGVECVSQVCDVTREEETTALARLAAERFGAVNLVLPFAGIIKDGLLLSPDKETGKVKKKMSLSDFQKVVDINLTGVFLTVRECGEQMINTGSRGLICLISSTGAQGTAGQINYSSTKAAMSTMPKVITAEFFRKGLADRIRCVAIAPGYVGTEMVKNMNQKALDGILKNVPIQRLIEPEEVVSLIGELYRNEALANDVFPINGGLRLGSRG